MATACASEPPCEFAETEVDGVMLAAVADVVDSLARLLKVIPGRPSRRQILATAAAFGERMAGAHGADGLAVLTDAEMCADLPRRFPGDAVAQAYALDAFRSVTRSAAS